MIYCIMLHNRCIEKSERNPVRAILFSWCEDGEDAESRFAGYDVPYPVAA